MAKRTEEQRLAGEWLPSMDEVAVSTVGLLAIGGLYFVVSDAIRIGPAWLLLVLEGVLLPGVVRLGTLPALGLPAHLHISVA